MAMANSEWRIVMERQPEKTLRRLPQNIGRRIDRAILALTENPHPNNSKKLIGYDNLYRIRIGSWRVIYAIEDEQLIILVIRIAPQGSVYHNIRWRKR